MSYAPEVRQRAREMYETTTVSLREIARQTGVSHVTLSHWAQGWHRTNDPAPVSARTTDAPLSPAEAREILAREARGGKSPVQAVKADLALRRHTEGDAGLTLPVPLTEEEVVRELSELMKACGPNATEAAWEKAWPTLESPVGQYVEWWEEQKRIDAEVARTTKILHDKSHITNRSRMW